MIAHQSNSSPPANRSDFLTTRASLIILFLVLARGNVSSLVAGEVATRPNIVLIVADDLGFSDLGCYGGEIVTPNLDKLAQNGIRFTDLHSTGRCWPSRSCLMAGYYPQQIHADPPNGLTPVWAPLLPQRLKPLGYRSYHSGKWHVRGTPEIVAGGGFEHSWQILDHDNFFNPDNATLDDQKFKINVGPDYYLTTDTTDHALNFLRDHHQQHGSDPFLLYLAYTAPHFPLMAPAEDIARCKGRYDVGWDVIQAQRHQRQLDMKIVDCALAPLPSDTVINKLGKEANPGEVGQAVLWTSLTPEQQHFQAQKMEIHAAMIERMDREIGRVLAHLATIGATDNTLIMFVSDNGASAEEIVRGGGNAANATPGSAASFLCLGPGWASAANAPFRLYKKYVHEGGTSSPAIVSWPAGIAARGELRHATSHFIDVVPTLLEVAGAPLEAKKGAPQFPGRSLVQAFAKDGQLTPEPIFFLHQGNAALRIGEMKLARIGTKGAWELYDVSKDRCEQINLAKAQPERVSEMVKEWERRDALYTEQAGPASKDKKKGKGDE